MDKIKETLLEVKSDIFNKPNLIDNYYKFLYMIMQSMDIEDQEYQYFLKENINDLIKFYKHNQDNIKNNDFEISFYNMVTNDAEEGDKMYCTVPSSIKHSLDRLRRKQRYISWSDI